MKKTLMLLVASTALTAVTGATAWSAMQFRKDAGQLEAAAPGAQKDGAGFIVLASGDDDDDDDDRRYRKQSRRDHDDDAHNAGDDDDDDDAGGRSGAGNPAPAGSVAPPQNGLFGNGAPPKVQVN